VNGNANINGTTISSSAFVFDSSVFRIQSDTADGSDNQRINISGGGVAGVSSRGAFLRVSGNEDATFPGQIVLTAGETGYVGSIGRTLMGQTLPSDDSSYDVIIGSNGIKSVGGFSAIYRDDSATETYTKLQKKVIEIGDWDMTGLSAINVAHGLGSSFSNIVSIQAVIRRDDGVYVQPLDRYSSTNGSDGGVLDIDNTNIRLASRSGGFFDSSNFDSTSYNRGWIYIEYEV
jgi:hypothetical protein